MPIRPRKRTLSAGVIGAAQELGELNPLKKAADAISGSGKAGGSVQGPKISDVGKDTRPHISSAPVRVSGFGGTSGRKPSPSVRKMRRGRRGGPRAF